MDQLSLDPDVMDTLQSTLECCGMYSVNYYYSIWNLPESCCPGNTGFCHVSHAYSEGCAGKILDIISPVFKGLGGFLVLLCLVQISLVIVLYAISPRSEKETDIKEVSYS
ncbi:cd63 antigen [Sparganum proliferum]